MHKPGAEEEVSSMDYSPVVSGETRGNEAKEMKMGQAGCCVPGLRVEGIEVILGPVPPQGNRLLSPQVWTG